MKKLPVAFVLIAALTLSACQTIQGAGRDIERAGESLERAVD